MFDDKGSLWVHISIAELVCEVLSGKNTVRETIVPTLLKLEEDAKKNNAKLKIFNHDVYLQLMIKAYVLEELTQLAYIIRERSREWLAKIHADPRRERLQVIEDDCKIFNILVNVIGIEQFLTGIDPFELDHD